ncbi:MAG: diacylglycerol kinase [Treponema sp.]|jgi:diacylglycerol kinase family enzyme|nr:diacylglycerol kinase [Treponema sp.]
MNSEIFAALLCGICARSRIVPDRPLRWTIITNPQAGGFTIRSRWKKHRAMLEASLRKAELVPPRPDSGPSLTARQADGSLGAYGLIPTTAAGHAGTITEALIDEIRSGLVSGGDRQNTPGKTAPFHLIITAGGDGTSREVQAALFSAPALVRSNCAVLRLPMGTGNDGADAPELDRALELLIAPAYIHWAGALRLTTAAPGKGPFLAFNILSIGLDAFVTHMTNRMKGRLPGDSYKLWVDIAALLYDRIYRVGPMDLRFFDPEGREQQAFREKVLLLAVGESGRRTYGSRKKILPDDRNVCLLRQMSLWRKMALKDLFNSGTHVDKPEARLFNAGRVEFRGEYPILAQMDGETVLLGPEDFPGTIEVIEKVIPVLKPQCV